MQRRSGRLVPAVLATALATGGLALTAQPALAANGGALLYGLTSANHLVSFRETAPGTALTDVAITGLAGGENVVGIDVRPATGSVLALGSTGRLYSVDPATGAATATTSTPPALTGTSFGIDINPTVDRLRVVSDADQSLRLNPDTGAVAATDTSLAYAGADPNVGIDPNVTAVGYTNSVATAGSTTLFGIDTGTDALVIINPPNNGTLNTVGALGFDTTAVAGLDIDAASGKAFAVLTVGGTPSLYTINLASGAATLVGAGVAGLTDVTVPVVARTAYVLLTDNTLATLDVTKPGTLSTPVAIAIPGGADVVGIDSRPANGALYAVTADSKLYTVVPTTGVATLVGTISVALAGTAFGVDFNPVADRLRIVSDSGQNLSVNPADGVATSQTPLNPGTPGVVGAGYTNNFAGATTTTLYDLDATADTLVTQSPPASGTLATVGAVGVDFTAASDLDIAADGNAAYAALTVGGAPSLYRINLSTGAASLLKAFPSMLVEDLALASPGRLTAANVATDESQTTAVVTVTRSAGSAGTEGVDYATSGGSATAGSDYTATSGRLTFADGETTKTFSIPLLQDTLTEGPETIGIVFDKELGGTAPVSSVTVTIADDEASKAYALTSDNTIGTFALNSPGTFSSTAAITGAGEDIVGIDIRPATGDLLGLGASGRLYRIDPTTGAATATTGTAPTLSGTSFGFDVNPVPDRVRVVSDTDQNLRLHPDTGALAAADGTLAYAAGDANVGANPNVIAAAYTNSVAGATSTTLYDVDSTLDVLVIQNPPNSGTLNTVGALGVDVSAAGDLDIAPNGNAAFGAFTPAAGVPTLYRANLTTGVLTAIGAFATTTVEDLALATPGRIGLSSANVAVAESGTSATVTVNRTGGSTGTATVDYATADLSATAGSDYTSTTGTLVFADGETTKSIVIPVADDVLAEGPESLKVTLTNAGGGAGTGPITTATVNINDNDTGVAYGLTDDGQVVTLNPSNPTLAASDSELILGLEVGERVLGIDVRPSNGVLYGITSSSRILTIDPATGDTEHVATSTALVSGTEFAVDFNPVADRLRVISDAGQNLRINVNTGAATVDTPVSYAVGDVNAGQTPAVTAAGYTGSAPGSTATVLYDLDTTKDVLVLQAPPNNGTLTTVGPLGVDATSLAGFDISSPGDSAFAVLRTAGGAPSQYRINLSTGTAYVQAAYAVTNLVDFTVATPVAALAGRFHALAPTRLIDTRQSTPVVAGADRTITVAGQAGVPATGVSAVALNITSTRGTRPSYVSVYPTGPAPSPITSNLNYRPKQNIAVQVQTGLGTGGAINVRVGAGQTDIVIDVLGWYGDGTDTTGKGYRALTPTRLLDTRTTSKVVAGTDRTQQVGGVGEVPSGATAVAVNVTVTGLTKPTFVQLYPGASGAPAVSSTINAVPGQTIANAAIVTLGPDGSIGIKAGAGSLNVVIDVVGYYGATGTNRFTPVTPTRLLDTRTTGPRLTAGTDRDVAVAGGIAGGAIAGVLVVTGSNASQPLFVQTYPTGNLPATPTSTINLVPSTDVANLAVTPLGTGGSASFKAGQGSTELIVDMTGYFSAS